MNINTRGRILAAKDILHQLTQTARDDGEIEMRQLENEKEKREAREKEKEEREYLKQHNKKVSRALTQAAKATNTAREGSDDEDGGTEEEDSEADSEIEDYPEATADLTASQGSKGKGREGEVNITNPASKGKQSISILPLFRVRSPPHATNKEYVP